MRIPQRYLKIVAQEAPSKFEEADRLNYVGAVALAANPAGDFRLHAYAGYFKAEQEQNSMQMNFWFRKAEEEVELAEVFELICGRKLLQDRTLSVEAMEKWFTRAQSGLPIEMHGYVNFLTGIGCLQAGDRKKAAVYLEKSAANYHHHRKYSRELQSLMQNPELNESEIRYLRTHAGQSGDLKSFHVGTLSLAAQALRDGDEESARRFGRDSVRAFRDEFLDPRRERIGMELLVRIDGQKSLSRLEGRLLHKLEGGACSKRELIHEVYGSEARRLNGDAIDTRFRTLISRLNRKLNGRISNHKGIYSLNS